MPSLVIFAVNCTWEEAQDTIAALEEDKLIRSFEFDVEVVRLDSRSTWLQNNGAPCFKHCFNFGWIGPKDEVLSAINRVLPKVLSDYVLLE